LLPQTEIGKASGKQPAFRNEHPNRRSAQVRKHLGPTYHQRGRDRAAKIIQDALGIKSDDVVNYTSPRFAAIHR
jgi:hypothetical protein